MANRFEGRGNLAAVPELKRVQVDGEERLVAELRIYFDRQVPDGDGGFTDRGGFWLTANLWGDRAEVVSNLLPKGARVHVTGTLVQDTWNDKESGEERRALELVADYVSLDLGRVDGLRLRLPEDAARSND